MNNDEDSFKIFSKIDESMGEKKSHQILGVVILIGIVIFSYLYKIGYLG